MLNIGIVLLRTKGRPMQAPQYVTLQIGANDANSFLLPRDLAIANSEALETLFLFNERQNITDPDRYRFILSEQEIGPDVFRHLSDLDSFIRNLYALFGRGYLDENVSETVFFALLAAVRVLKCQAQAVQPEVKAADGGKGKEEAVTEPLEGLAIFAQTAPRALGPFRQRFITPGAPTTSGTLPEAVVAQLRPENICSRFLPLIWRYLDQVPEGTLLPFDTVVELFQQAPAATAQYLRRLSDALYASDSFTQEIINYYQRLIAVNEQFAYALMPHAYPYTKPERINRFNRHLFLLDPLRDSRPLLPDYMDAEPCAAIPAGSFRVPPPATVTLASKERVTDRLLQVFPQLLQMNDWLTRRIQEMLLERQEAHAREGFHLPAPGEEHPPLGYVLGGGLFSIVMDDWLYERFVDKTDVDLFIYGKTHDARSVMYELLLEWLQQYMPTDEYYYAIRKSVLTLTRRLSPNQVFVLQIIATDCQTPLEVLMNFDTSNIQVGYDIHHGLCCAPLFSLYYRKREAVLIRYNIRAVRLVKALYRGFSVKLIMPYSFITSNRGSFEQFELTKGKPVLISKTLEAAGVRVADRPRPLERPTRRAPQEQYWSLPGDEGNYHVVFNDQRYDTLRVRAADKEAFHPRGAPRTEELDLDQLKLDGRFRNGFDDYIEQTGIQNTASYWGQSR